jgi:hypothetical protein
MLIQHTMTQLKSLKLDGMARALEEQQIMPARNSPSKIGLACWSNEKLPGATTDVWRGYCVRPNSNRRKPVWRTSTIAAAET